jgi:anti-sigma factor ChrR (cupin superfamily)
MKQHSQADDIPAFALGALDPEEALQVGEHLARCPSCRDQVAAYHAIVGLLCYAIPPHEPPAQLRQRILTHIALDTESCAATFG